MASHDIRVTISADGTQAVKEADKVKGALTSVSHTRVSNGSMNALAHGARNANHEVKRLHNSVESLPTVLAKVGAAISAAFAVGSILSIGKAALKASSSMELLKKGLSFTLGNSEAKRLIKNIQGIGEASAYDATQLMPMARAWINLGDNVDAASEKIQRIVDLGSAYGLSADEIDRANVALSQMQMAGKIGAQDMMQLTNANIPAWKLLADKMGLSVIQLKEMSAQGQLTQEAMDMLFDAMKEQTGGAAKDLADTLMGKVSNIEESITNSMAIVGDIISSAFNVKGVLDNIGNLAQAFKDHMEDIRASIANGTQPIAALKNKLNEVAPGVIYAAGAFAAFVSVKAAISGVEMALGLVNTVLRYQAVLIGAVQTAYGMATVAARLFSVAWKADPFLLAAAAVIAAIMLILANWKDVCEGMEKLGELAGKAIVGIWNGIQKAFDDIVNGLKRTWEGFIEFIEHPIETTLRVNREYRDADRAYKNSWEADRKAAASYYAGKGQAKGGIFGGLVPLANGGQLKHGTPAIVGEAGPEAVLPLRKEVLSKIGEAIFSAYSKGKNGIGDVADIRAKISAEADTGQLSEYEKILGKAEEKAAAVGEELRKFHELEAKATQEMAAYEEQGEKTIAMRAALARASGDAEKKSIQDKYDAEKTAAIKTAEEIASVKMSIEGDAAAAIQQIREKASSDIFSHEAALQEAQAQLRRANQAQDLDSFAAMMQEKDEMTGESFAATLANEQYLSDMRRAWHEEQMLQSVEWGEYMQYLLTDMTQSLQTGLADSLTNCIMQGESLGRVFLNIGNNLLNIFIKGVLQKAISNLGILQTLSAKNHAQELANAKTEAAAQAGKTGVMAANAAAAIMAANPWTAAGAGALVAGQMSIARGASALFSVGFAEGGAVFGGGTSVSDSIPAMLSDGEYVVNADAVSRIGVPTLNMINEGRLPHFSEGGAVSGKSPETMDGGASVTVNVSAIDASSFSAFLERGGLDSIRQALFDNNREFATESGVW